MTGEEEKHGVGKAGNYNAKDRILLEEEILYSFAKAMDSETFQKAKSLLAKMSNDDFFQMISEIKECYQYNNVSAKRVLDLQEHALNAFDVGVENYAFYDVPLRFLSDDLNEKIVDDISFSNPSDSIEIDWKTDEMLSTIYKFPDINHKLQGIPSDIFFTDTIPLLDCYISVDERGKEPNGVICNSRIIIFEDYKQRINSGADVPVGVTMIEINKSYHAYLLFPMLVTNGSNYLSGGGVGYLNIPKQYLDILKANTTMGQAYEIAAKFMQTWYGIQIALLHPQIKDVFQRPKMVKQEVFKANTKNKTQRVTKYIKKHIIKADDIEKAQCVDSGSGKRERKTLVWYVIGHWRNYKSGKKIFVKPYWKGEMRNLKMNLDERKRLIDVPETIGD